MNQGRRQLVVQALRRGRLARCTAGLACCVAYFGAIARAQPVAAPVFQLQPAAVTAMPGSMPIYPSKVAYGRAGTVVGYQVITTTEAVQFQGPVINQRRPTYSTRSGFQITLTANATSQFGYQPITVTASLQTAATSERTVRFRFLGGSYYTNGKSITVEETLRLSPGDASATATLLVPQYQDWQRVSWDVIVDGKEDDELSVEYVNSFGMQGLNVSMTSLIVSDRPGLLNLQQPLQVVGNGSASVRTRRLNELTDNWLHYTTLDVVAIDADEATSLARLNPKGLAAVLCWVRAGGNLWIVDTGPDWEELAAAERALGLKPRAVRPARVGRQSDEPAEARDGETPRAEADPVDPADAAVLARGWKFVPLNERQLEPVEGALEISGYDLGEAKPATSPPGASGTVESLVSQADPTSKSHFAVRPHGLGAIVAFRRDLNGLDGPAAIAAIQRSLLAPRLSNTVRLGNRPDSSNAEFNNWLIPGVGVAPVGLFQFLITLFVLGIGPLNYWWLKRQKRLPFLLVTVPAAAVTVTLLLLVFGVLADGLGVQVRARSLTMLDQTEGQAATWARVSYYAGLNPRRGLTMPADTAIYPVLSDWNVGRYGRGPSAERELQWRAEQVLRRGWLAPRTPTQYLTIRSGPNEQRLDLRNTNEGLRIRNRFDANVTHLVVQDHDGVLYWCEGLKPGQGRVVPPAEERDVSTKMRRLFADNFPEFPPGADPTQFGMAYSDLLSKNLMETQIEAINSPVVQRWIDGSYIAVTDRGINVDLGLDNAQEEASFHVVRGTW